MSGIVEKTRGLIAGLMKEALVSAGKKGILPVVEAPDFVVEAPREKDHGDFATNMAMLLAKPARTAPRKIAEALTGELDLKNSPVEKVEVAGPGFINFYLKSDWAFAELPQILSLNENYGRVNIGGGRKIQVEFVSANPTGLLHMGNARGAALGDSLASILDFAGYEVTREFYINDAGNQIEHFGRSLEARYLQLLGKKAEVPEEGYHGEDITDTMRGFIESFGDAYLETPEGERREVMVSYALEEKIADIKNTLEDFGVLYDVWFSEKALHRSGQVRDAIKRLGERGYLYEQEDAVWFKATDFGVEKDEVLVRSNGVPTYFAADIAYHMNKFERGFHKVINIWGADHHGHVPRMKGVVEALGYDPEALQVILMQLVRLYKNGVIVRMSKRTGQFVTLEELLEEVGRDVARYFFVMRSPDSHLEFDMDLAKSRTNDNPVFYIQYAHARICSILRQLAELGRELPDPGRVDYSLLNEESELMLIRKLAEFPEEVAASARDMAPHRMSRYLHEVAGLFHSYYNAHRVISDREELTDARAALACATRTVIRNGLRLLGLSAPEKM
ncbi:MAG: arginine--tRNA ligase [Peptococcaceae bacterium BICA1-7]|nr:MAG: arginine--tRNA ligase [Peptococcaceae bacterium BICA1-7]HBV96222.1 arginine--tRNA ligase [Desulfotomaculum sp.]